MGTDKLLDKTSKFLSFVLRHKPDAIGIELDNNGWANIDELIRKAKFSGENTDLDRELIQEVVHSSNKKRFVISENGLSIRANQGHSINVDLQLKMTAPPEFLYHGTATRFLYAILSDGLKPQKRRHLHLSTDIETAATVGQRHGKPVVLKIKALLMHEQGFLFYVSSNGVWLTDFAPKTFISIQH